MKKLLILALGLLLMERVHGAPLRVAVAGLSHGHVGQVMAAAERGEVEIVGVWDADADLRARWEDKYRTFSDLGTMLDQTKPEAAMAYGSVWDHLAVVEACAPRGVHVMVEKPLAVDGKQAQRMAGLARRHGIHLLTNYETTWYPANHSVKKAVDAGTVGRVVRIDVFDGHQGPVEIGCGPEFLAWLTDPHLNGGGAVIDFGCYGANLVTWLLDGRRPVSVYAVLKQLKPDVYPNVDDDATILLEYPHCTVRIAASWAWPMSRKDMHIYGSSGYIYQDDARNVRSSASVEVSDLEYGNEFNYLTAVVRGGIVVKPGDLSSLENNLVVMEILDAARRSAKSKKVVYVEKN